MNPSLTVLAARDAYLAENGFDTSGYTANTFDVEAFGRSYSFRNTADRKWAIPLHDLHHVATGYGTDLVGEAEIGAFELVGGCRTPVVYGLNIVAVAMGFFVAPLRTLRAFAHARRAGARALYRTPATMDDLLALSLGDLRARLGLPHAGLSVEPRRRHDEQSAPSLPAWALAVGLLNALATVATVSLRLGWQSVPTITAAVATLVLACSAPAARRGSLGGRAIFGHIALALVVGHVLMLLVR